MASCGRGEQSNQAVVGSWHVTFHGALAAAVLTHFVWVDHAVGAQTSCTVHVVRGPLMGAALLFGFLLAFQAFRVLQAAPRDTRTGRGVPPYLSPESLPFEAVMSACPLAVVVMGPDRRVLLWNPAAERLFGRVSDAVLGRVACVEAADGRDVLTELAERVLSDDCGATCCEDFLLAVDGRHDRVRVWAAPFDDGVRRVSGVILLASELAEKNLPPGCRFLESLYGSRARTVGLMARGLVHEINQPLSVIGMALEGCLRMLRSESNETCPPWEHALQVALAETRRAREIVRRFRDFTQRKPADKVPLRVAEVIRQSLELARVDPRFDSVAVQYHPAEDLPPVLADTVQIQQVLLNLIRNALDAMEQHPASRRRLSLSARLTEQGQVEVAVADTGRAVPEHELAVMFEPFFTTKKEGMGMGLAISRFIVDGHGGCLYAEANDEGGMTFRFTLPVAEELEDGRSFGTDGVRGR